MKRDMINIEYAVMTSKLKCPSPCVIDMLINLFNEKYLGCAIEQICSVYYSLCDIDTLVRAEDTPAELYTCRNCIFREAVDESNIICPHKVIASGDDVIK